MANVVKTIQPIFHSPIKGGPSILILSAQNYIVNLFTQ